MGGDAFAPAGETEALGCGGFDGDRVKRKVEVFGYVLNHPWDVGEESGGLGDDGYVDVDGGEVALFPYNAGCLAEELAGVCSFVAGIGVGEVVAYIAESCGSEHGVCKGVESDIGVAVAEQTAVVWNFNSAED